MKKVIAFGLAVVLFFGFLFFDRSVLSKPIDLQAGLNYHQTAEKFNCPQAVKEVMDENTVLLLGSSELFRLNEASYPSELFNQGNSDFNVMMIGQGYCQSLAHALNVGALADGLESKKVVLLLSPQWFTEPGIAGDAFCSVFREQMYAEFMKNPAISTELKKAVVDRCRELTSGTPSLRTIVDQYADVYVDHTLNPVSRINLSITDSFQKDKALYQLNRQLKDTKFETRPETVHAQDIDFDQLMQFSEQQGKESCTNNSFYIFNDYYTQYVEPNLEHSAGSNAKSSYATSVEYSDLQLFLDVCKETGVEVMLVSIPVNGFWYDYTAFPAADRQQYYQNIRTIAQKNNVSLLDLSEHEYTPYFLRDIMHLGWKGWVYIVEGIYEFYQKD